MDANGDGEVSEKEYTATQMKMVPAASHEAVGCVTFWRSGYIPAPASFVTGVACCVCSDMLENALRDVAALRRERRAFRSALVEVLRGAFELADAGGDGDGEVSLEECLRLDAEIAVRASKA